MELLLPSSSSSMSPQSTPNDFPLSLTEGAHVEYETKKTKLTQVRNGHFLFVWNKLNEYTST